MKKLIGRFVDYSPIIRTSISPQEKLRIGRGSYLLVIDSGFTGDISAPAEILDKLSLEYAGTMPFQLADRTIVWKDLWGGTILLGDDEYEALFIEGDFLLGMELASDLFSYFLIDFIKEKVILQIR